MIESFEKEYLKIFFKFQLLNLHQSVTFFHKHLKMYIAAWH